MIIFFYIIKLVQTSELDTNQFLHIIICINNEIKNYREPLIFCKIQSSSHPSTHHNFFCRWAYALIFFASGPWNMHLSNFSKKLRILEPSFFSNFEIFWYELFAVCYVLIYEIDICLMYDILTIWCDRLSNISKVSSFICGSS